MNLKESTIEAIRKQGFLPLFYEDSPLLSLEVVRALYESGVRVLEYTNRGPAALENFKILTEAKKENMPELQLGVGTIKNLSECKDFLNVGADFVVCPVTDTAVGRLTHAHGRLWIPGAMTPTEINLAHQADAGIIKLFPANFIGPSYLASIKELFPGQLFVPTGGVDLTEASIAEWFSAGVCAVGLGSKLIRKTILQHADYSQLQALTRQLFEIVQKTNPFLRP